jgi:hypothetical protein
MATLVVHAKGAPPARYPLVKPLTSVGAGAESDLRVPDVRGVVAIQFDGSNFTATALEGAALVVNGKKRGQHTLSDGDTLQLGATQLVFQSADRIPTPAEGIASAGAQPPLRGTMPLLSPCSASPNSAPSWRASPRSTRRWRGCSIRSSK